MQWLASEWVGGRFFGQTKFGEFRSCVVARGLPHLQGIEHAAGRRISARVRTTAS